MKSSHELSMAALAMLRAESIVQLLKLHQYIYKNVHFVIPGD